MRDLLYVPPGVRRRAQSVCSSRTSRTRSSPRSPRPSSAHDGERVRLDPVQHRERRAREVEYVHMLLDRRVDGMIFISCEVTDLSCDHYHYRPARDGARLVFVNGGSPQLDIPSVGVDERAAAELATQHLVDLGHTRIAFASFEHYLPPAPREGRKQVGAGCSPSADRFRRADRARRVRRRRRSARRSRKLLARHDPPPTGVICSNDLMAVGVLRTAEPHGPVRVPDDLSVVGFDGIEATSWTNPALTTIEQPIAEIAQTAVRALRTLIENGSQRLPNYVFRPRLRLGRSTAPLGG